MENLSITTTLIITTIRITNTNPRTTNHTYIKEHLIMSDTFHKIMEITDPKNRKNNTKSANKHTKPTTWTQTIATITVPIISAVLISTIIVTGTVVIKNSKRRVYHVPPVVLSENYNKNEQHQLPLPILKLPPENF